MDSKKIAIIAGVSVAIILVFLFSISLEIFSNVPEKNHVPQAVIIDQLYSDVPSDYFDTNFRMKKCCLYLLFENKAS